MEKEIKLNLDIVSPEEAAASRKNFKDFCESLTNQLKGKGSHSFFEATKQIPFRDALFAQKELPQVSQDEGNLWQAIQSHTNHLFGRNGHHRKGNAFLDIFKSRNKGEL